MKSIFDFFQSRLTLKLFIVCVSLSLGGPVSALELCQQNFINYDSFFEVFENLPYEYPQKHKLEIAQQGEPVLRHMADPIPHQFIEDERIQALIDQMEFTMKKAGGVGIAAPQVFIPFRLLIAQKDVMINPEYTPVHRGKTISFEGCLSMAYCGFVTRYRKIKVSYTDRNGRRIHKTLRGFSAIVVQHEVDHLNGRLFSDGYIEAYRSYLARAQSFFRRRSTKRLQK